MVMVYSVTVLLMYGLFLELCSDPSNIWACNHPASEWITNQFNDPTRTVHHVLPSVTEDGSSLRYYNRLVNGAHKTR